MVVAVLKQLIPLKLSLQEHCGITCAGSHSLKFTVPVSIADNNELCYAQEIESKCIFLDFTIFKYNIVMFPSNMTFD